MQFNTLLDLTCLFLIQIKSGMTLVEVSSNNKVMQGANNPPQLVNILNLGYIYCLVSGLGIFLSALDTQAHPCVPTFKHCRLSIRMEAG